LDLGTNSTASCCQHEANLKGLALVTNTHINYTFKNGETLVAEFKH